MKNIKLLSKEYYELHEYLQVMLVIQEGAYIRRPASKYSAPLAKWEYYKPKALIAGKVVFEDYYRTMTSLQFVRTVKLYDLHEKIGLYEFTPINNPARPDVLYCRDDPETAGLELHRLKTQLTKIEKVFLDYLDSEQTFPELRAMKKLINILRED